MESLIEQSFLVVHHSIHEAYGELYSIITVFRVEGYGSSPVSSSGGENARIKCIGRTKDRLYW
jgi:hypothetical protein